MINSILYKSLTVSLIIISIIFAGALSAKAALDEGETIGTSPPDGIFQDTTIIIEDGEVTEGYESNTSCKLKMSISAAKVDSLIDVTPIGVEVIGDGQTRITAVDLVKGEDLVGQTKQASQGGVAITNDYELESHWGTLCKYTQVKYISKWIFLISGIITLLLLIISGCMYMMSKKDKKGRKKAAKLFMFSVIGFVFVLLSQTILIVAHIAI